MIEQSDKKVIEQSGKNEEFSKILNNLSDKQLVDILTSSHDDITGA